MDGLVLMPGEGESLPAGTATVTLKAVAELTAGGFSMSEVYVEAGYPGPPPHRHGRMLDSFYVLEGELSVLVGDAWLAVPAGGYVAAPPGVVHTFANPGDRPVRVLNITSPAGFEDYLRELSAALRPGVPPDPAEIGAIVARHDTEIVAGPPPPGP